MTRGGDEPAPFDWAWLVPRVVHPVQVAIIEAMAWIDSRLSPAELTRMLVGQPPVSGVSYHVDALVKAEVLEEVDARPKSGSTEHFFFFTEELRQ
jgi:hypothetical protein